MIFPSTGTRLDELEKSIGDLMQQANMADQPEIGKWLSHENISSEF